MAHPQQTQLLYEPKKPSGDSNDLGVVVKNSAIPRSFVSNGSLTTLVLHVLVQLSAFVLTLIGLIFAVRDGPKGFGDLPVTNALVALTSTCHGFGIGALLFVAALVEYPTSSVWANALTFSLFLFTLCGSGTIFTLTIKADELLMEESIEQHIFLYFGIFLQLLAGGLVSSNAINLAAYSGYVHQGEYENFNKNRIVKTYFGNELNRN